MLGSIAARRFFAAIGVAAGLIVLLSSGCSDKKIIEPECEGCYRFNVAFPSSGTQNVLRDVFFIDSGNGWVVGHDGLVLHSSDSGAAWTIQRQKIGQRLWSVHFLAPDLGWVINELDSLVRTGDGGDTWTEWRIGSGRGLTSVFILDLLRGWIVGDSVILRTDNGTSWQVYDDIDNVVSTLYGVTFATPNRGWAVGSGGYKILYTDDGGDHWIPQDNPSTQPLLDVVFVDASNGWAVGVGATVIHTVDGGLTWTKQSIGTDRVLHGVDFRDVSTGVVVGDSGVVYTTTDGGVTWEERASGTTNDLLKVSYVNAETFCACGYNGSLLLVTRRWEECCE